MQKENIKKISANVLVAFIFILTCLPVITYSEQSPDSDANKTGIVYECATDTGKTDTNGNKIYTYGNCDFNDLLKAINKVVKFGMTLALSLSVVVIAVAGGKYMLGADSAGERKKANDMLVRAAKGIAFMLAAWLIVTLITNALLREEVKNLVPLR